MDVRFQLGLFASLFLLATTVSAEEVVDPVEALEGGLVTAVTVGQELRDRQVKDLGFAFPDDWREPLARDLLKELERLELLAPHADETDPPPVEQPVRARLILTNVYREERDRGEIRSQQSWVVIRISARLELSVEGEELPRVTDPVEATAEARTLGPMRSTLYEQAYLNTFEALGIRAAGQVQRRMRPELYEEKKHDGAFAPFRPWRRP